jgi:O-antigen ligase
VQDLQALANAAWGFFFAPTKASLSNTNILFFCVCLCLAPFAGSAMSAYVAGGIVYGVWLAMRGEAPFPRIPEVRITALAFASFALAEAVAALVNPGGAWISETGSNLPFLGILPLFAVIRADRQRLLALVEKYAAMSCIAGAAVLIPLANVYARGELMTGNPGVLAVLASVLYAINVLALIRHRERRPWLFAAGAAAAAYLVLSAGMRSLWPMLVLAPVIALAFYGRRVALPVNSAPALAAGAAAVLLVGSLVFQQVSFRLDAAQTDISAIDHQNYSTSLGRRVVMWEAGYALFMEKPLLGQGPGNSSDLMRVKTKEISGQELGYSHFHNAAITELVRAGIVGLLAMAAMFAAPFLLCLRAQKDETGKAGFYLLCAGQCAYLLSGLTGIMFGHDILDSFYLTLTVFSLYLVFGEHDDVIEAAR